MTDANTICHDLDLLDDWLAGKGYGEEAGLVLRALSLIHEQEQVIEKLQRKSHDAIVKYQRLLMQYEPEKAAAGASATFKGDDNVG